MPHAFDLAPIGNPQYQQVVARPFLDPEGCRRVLDSLSDDGWTRAGITEEGTRASAYDERVRSATLQRLPEDETWPLAELVSALGEINSEVYRFELTGFFDSDWPSVARYDASHSDHFRPHQDAGGGHCRRKLTYVVQLSDGQEYGGGDLMIKDGGVVAPRDQGTLIAFPSTLFHVVSPVTAGTRHALIGWVHGPTIS